MVRLFLALFLGINFSVYGQGNTVGKGGDTIKCEPTSLNDFNGHYTLDYLLEYNSGEFHLSQDTNFEKMKAKLQQYFGLEQVELAQSLENFSGSLFKQDEAMGRVWKKSETPLYDIKDEEIIKRIPENCLVLEAGIFVLKLRQTVIRQTVKNYVEYHYDEEILIQQKQQNPVQYSFFLVHEWLWDFTRNIESLRKLNWLLHSSQLEKMSKGDFKLFLEKINFGIVDLPVCERSTIVRNLFNKDCQEISKRDLLNLNTLKLDYAKSMVRPGDIYGFSKVKSLNLVGANALPPRFFNSLYQLENLDLSSSKITALSEMTLMDLKYIKSIKLNQALSKNAVQLKLIKTVLNQVEVKVAE
jgi:hypothetical protein